MSRPLALCLLVVLVGSACAEWRWEGKVAVVTGASSGIGAATALALADRGVKVVGLARREDKIKELSSRTNGTIFPIKCDLTKEEEILKSFRLIEEKFGGVDILINNAGVFLPSAALINGTTDEWKTTLRTNVLAVSICSREALKTMRKRGDNGHIVNINSVSGHKVPEWKNLHVGMYYASKHALTALSESLRIELLESASRIKMTSVSPGVVNTHAYADDKEAKDETKILPYIEAVDVADSVIYVLGTKPTVQIHELTIQAIGHSTCGI